MRPDWVDEEVIDAAPLRDAQVKRLLAMNKVLQNPTNLQQVLAIKNSFDVGKSVEAVALFDDFTDDEQTALLIAPLYGGIFTTEERKMLTRGPEENE